jgi:LiaI-LiaF-like transmembrane region
VTDPTSRMPLPSEPTGEPTGPASAETGTFGASPGESAPPPSAPTPSPPPPATSMSPALPPIAASPPSSSGPSEWRPARTDEGRWGTVVFGLILVGIGIWFLAEVTLGIEMPDISWDQVWPIILIVVGLWIVLSARRRRAG